MTFDFNELIARARDASLDDELRYGAVMAISAATYKVRARALDHAVERPGRPRLDDPGAGADAPASRSPQPEPPAKGRQGKPRGVETMRDFLVEQLQVIDHYDRDGRPIGLRYDIIERRLLERFPVVAIAGRYKGRPPSTDRKKLHELSSDLRREGFALPFRPRASGNPRLRRPLTAEHRAAIKAGQQRRRARPVRGVMVTVEAADMLFTHECVVCRRPFRPASLDTPRGVRKPPRYCSPGCKQEAYRRREAAA